MVAPREQPIGWHEHEAGVQKLRASFAAIPPHATVRLGKRTSNLFRRRRATTVPGLDVSGLRSVIAIDHVTRTADVQGMCTYEDLIAATLRHGLAPYVVPQLKTITLGGAVTGLGIESTGFRNGLPHESVLEMDVLVGDGRVVTCAPTVEPALFRAFPNSYGSLGYAVRLRIELEPVAPYVAVRHVRYHDLSTLQADLAALVESAAAGTAGDIARNTAEYAGERVDYLDGVVFSAHEAYLVLGRQTDEAGPTSDYTSDRIYYQSLRHPDGVLRDRLTIHDYLWRWDTDWFWCSRAFGTQNPRLRRLWPDALKRSSVYWKLVALDKRWRIDERLRVCAGRPPSERVVQDIEVRVEHTTEFLRWFFPATGIEPVWLCPLRLRAGAAGSPLAGHPWPLYPLTAETTWVNIGFWSGVERCGDEPPGFHNRRIERFVSELGGHKSLYSEAFYSRDEFDAMYGGRHAEQIKAVWDPARRFPGLYDKTVRGE